MSSLSRAVLAPLSALSSPGWWRSVSEFHAYHGPWALGVRLLRRWSVRAKVLLLLLIVALPLVPLTLNTMVQYQQAVEGSERQLARLHLADTASRLGTEFSNQLQLLAAGQDSDPAKVQALYPEWQEALARMEQLGGELPDQHAEQARLVARGVELRGLSPSARADAMGRAFGALLALRQGSVALHAVDAGPLNSLAAIAVSDMTDLQIAIYLVRSDTVKLVQLRAAEDRPTVALKELEVEIAAQLFQAQRLIKRIQAEPQVTVVRGANAGSLLPHTGELLQVARALLLEQAVPGGPAEAEALGQKSRQEVGELRGLLVAAALLQLETQLAHARQTRLWVAGMLLVCLSLVGYLGYSFFLVMAGGLSALNVQMNRMAAGDLSARPRPLGGDEVAQTMTAMSTSLARLSDLLASVRHGVGAVTQAAEQVALGNSELAGRSRTSSAALDGVVEAVRRYSTQLEACGREVETVVGIVQELRLDAMRNRKQTQRLQEQMNSLRLRSREIADIVRLIDSIAFRTNILSLNAQVEASKAGEAGRGFAVVAQEVRSLAQRSADSARRIDAIVVRSTEDIEKSGALADETGKALASVDEHVDRIHAAMQGVAGLTRTGEQEAAAILGEIRHLQQGSAQNLELVDQLAGAADSLRGQGVKLAHNIAQFRLA